MSQKIILDTDIGDDIDDAIALSFAARWPEVELVAVTTSHVCVRERARMAAKQLSLLGASHVPYAPGRPRPIGHVDAETEQAFRSRLPTGYAVVREDEDLPPPACEDAVALMRRVIAESPGEITLVAIGALTNVACLLREEPNAADQLRGVAIMGGDLSCDHVEYNIRCDPEAAAAVLASPAMKFMGTFDVTRRVVMLEPEVRALRDSRDPACLGLVEQIELWGPHRGAKPGPVVYDIAPILWTADPSFFTTRSIPVEVILEGKGRGRTVEVAAGRPIEVSVDMRHEDALSLLMKTLLMR